MKCEAAQDWLLQCESLQPKSWPRGVVKHLRVCPSCYQFAKQIKRLEKAWRNVPVPEECEGAKMMFLAKLADLEQSEKPRPKRERRMKVPASRPAGWGNMRWLAVAAALFLGILGVGWLLPGRHNSPNNNKVAKAKNDHGDDKDKGPKEPDNADTPSPGDLLDRLVTWNVQLANTEPKDRRQLYDDYEPSFRSELKRTLLAADEMQLASDLLDSGKQLASADNPFAEAQAVSTVNEKLFSQAASAVNSGNEAASQRSGMRYSQFNTYAFKPMWDRLANYKGDPTKQFDSLYKGSPQFTNQLLHSKFDMWAKKAGPGFGPPGFKGKR